MKNRFHILILSPKYNLQIQAQIPAALCAVHNFIRFHDPDEGPAPDADDFLDDEGTGQHDAVEEEEHNVVQDSREMSRMCDCIAEDMWVDYQRVLHDRGPEVSETDSEPEVDDDNMDNDELEDTDTDIDF